MNFSIFKKSGKTDNQILTINIKKNHIPRIYFQKFFGKSEKNFEEFKKKFY